MRRRDGQGRRRRPRPRRSSRRRDARRRGRGGTGTARSAPSRSSSATVPSGRSQSRRNASPSRSRRLWRSAGAVPKLEANMRVDRRGPHLELPPGPRRPARARRRRRLPLPRVAHADGTGTARRLPRRRPLLRPQRLPHHLAPARRVGGPEAASTCSASGSAARGACCRRSSSSSSSRSILAAIFARGDLGRTRGRRGQLAPLLHELAPDRREPVLLRPHGAARAAGPPLVARGGGAVLRHLAAAARAGARAPRPPPATASSSSPRSGARQRRCGSSTTPATRRASEYGTDTRAFLLLLGHPARARLAASRADRRSLPLLELLGVAALATTIFLFREMRTSTRRSATAATSRPRSASPSCRCSRPSREPAHGALGVAPLRWVGERSYGIYLWHFPIIELTRPGVDVRWTGPGLILVQAILTVGAAALSYRFVEQPIRTGACSAGSPGWRCGAGWSSWEQERARSCRPFLVLFVTPSSHQPGSGSTSTRRGLVRPASEYRGSVPRISLGWGARDVPPEAEASAEGP